MADWMEQSICIECSFKLVNCTPETMKTPPGDNTLSVLFFSANVEEIQMITANVQVIHPQAAHRKMLKLTNLTKVRPSTILETDGKLGWMMTKKEEPPLIFERKIFRRIYGPKYENGEWRSRTNRELEEMSKGENIVKRIKGQRISWLGHLERIEEDRMPKKIFTQELEGTRRRGRPRKGQREVERDVQVLGVRRWRELVIDRDKWRGIVR